MKVLRLHTLRLLLMALIVLPVATSCYDHGEECEMQQEASSVNYIKLNISVRTSNAITRGTPLGGENGDGLEAGFARENTVDGITLILYRSDDGINAPGTTPIDFVRYYDTTLESRANQGTTNTTRFDEAVYTTGNRELDAKDGILTNTKYHAIVVANANLMGTFHKGSTLTDVRDYLVDGSMLYSGSGKMNDAGKFIMSSEADFTMDFTNTTPETYNEGKLYSFDNIYIERLAARIDFWANGSNGYKTKDKNNVDYPNPGYEYNVGSTTDRFVLVNVVPFNVSRGNEYLIKRTTHETTPYLANETVSSWVIDPYTSNKYESSYPTYMESKLESIVSSTNFSTLLYNVSMASQQSNTEKYQISGADNMIVGYTSENTLNASSLLYYNATGLAFEGYYYVDGDATRGERCVYYHYLRHQGESDAAYQALQASELSTSATCGSVSTIPMNYGIVRNNLYRVSVSGINSKTNLTIKIKVKKWDPFTHEVIYM